MKWGHLDHESLSLQELESDIKAVKQSISSFILEAKSKQINFTQPLLTENQEWLSYLNDSLSKTTINSYYESSLKIKQIELQKKIYQKILSIYNLKIAILLITKHENDALMSQYNKIRQCETSSFGLLKKE
jgi:hypothetical protein